VGRRECGEEGEIEREKGGRRGGRVGAIKENKCKGV
jgi:hypothetical protein